MHKREKPFNTLDTSTDKQTTPNRQLDTRPAQRWSNGHCTKMQGMQFAGLLFDWLHKPMSLQPVTCYSSSKENSLEKQLCSRQHQNCGKTALCSYCKHAQGSCSLDKLLVTSLLQSPVSARAHL